MTCIKNNKKKKYIYKNSYGNELHLKKKKNAFCSLQISIKIPNSC